MCSCATQEEDLQLASCPWECEPDIADVGTPLAWACDSLYLDVCLLSLVACQTTSLRCRLTARPLLLQILRGPEAQTTEPQR